MPRTWRPPDNKPMTPLASVLWQYLRANTRGIYTPADLAREIGTWHNTILNWFNGRSVPGVVMLQRIHEVTGIPLQQLLDAAGGSRRVSPTPPPPALPVEAIYPPQPRRRERQTPPVIAEHAPNTALSEAIARIRASYHPSMAEVMVQALIARAEGRNPDEYWQTRIHEAPPWDDHDAVGTLELPAITAGQQQIERYSAPETNTQRSSEPLMHK